jgi:hypothetical protein
LHKEITYQAVSELSLATTNLPLLSVMCLNTFSVTITEYQNNLSRISVCLVHRYEDWGDQDQATALKSLLLVETLSAVLR